MSPDAIHHNLGLVAGLKFQACGGCGAVVRTRRRIGAQGVDITVLGGAYERYVDEFWIGGDGRPGDGEVAGAGNSDN